LGRHAWPKGQAGPRINCLEHDVGEPSDEIWFQDHLATIPEETVRAMRSRILEAMQLISYGGKSARKARVLVRPDYRDAVDVIMSNVVRTIGGAPPTGLISTA